MSETPTPYLTDCDPGDEAPLADLPPEMVRIAAQAHEGEMVMVGGEIELPAGTTRHRVELARPDITWLEALEEAATPGPWEWSEVHTTIYAPDGGFVAEADGEQNGPFIAAVRNALSHVLFYFRMLEENVEAAATRAEAAGARVTALEAQVNEAGIYADAKRKAFTALADEMRYRPQFKELYAEYAPWIASITAMRAPEALFTATDEHHRVSWALEGATARIDELEEALKPLAALADHVDRQGFADEQTLWTYGVWGDPMAYRALAAGHARAARRALDGQEVRGE